MVYENVTEQHIVDFGSEASSLESPTTTTDFIGPWEKKGISIIL